MKIQYNVKYNLEFSENSLNRFASVVKNSPVSFLPDQIHKNNKRYSSWFFVSLVMDLEEGGHVKYSLGIMSS
jgi:hypothetical protein